MLRSSFWAPGRLFFLFLAEKFGIRRLGTNGVVYYRDTVASVGVIMGRTLPFVNSNKAIKTFRHALALDEVGPSKKIIINKITNKTQNC